MFSNMVKSQNTDYESLKGALKQQINLNIDQTYKTLQRILFTKLKTKATSSVHAEKQIQLHFNKPNRVQRSRTSPQSLTTRPD